LKRITLQLIMEYLERFGWKNYDVVDQPSEREGIIYTGWRASEQSPVYMVSIDPMIEKRCISFRTQSLVQAPQSKVSEKILFHLLMTLEWINYRIIVGKFSYEPFQGEVHFSIDLPIDENTISYAQFVHSLGLVVEIVETYTPLIKQVREGNMTAEQFIESDLKGEMFLEKRMVSEELKKLLEALGRISLN